MRKANGKLIIGIGAVIGMIAIVGLMTMNASAVVPSGFVFIDENGNGQFDAGEWNSTTYEGIIQDAVDNASDGDTIYVWDGHYFEDNITVNKPLTIIGNTTVNALEGIGIPSTSYIHYYNKGFIIESDYVNISGFYMINEGTPLPCGGVSINNSDHCNISGNIIMQDYDGIYLNNSHYNAIYNNYIAYNFIGIWMVNGSGHNTIEMNNISLNDGYGIVYEPQPYDYSGLCWNTIMYNNISYNGMWGIMMGNTSNETIMHNDFYGNGDGEWGGAVYFSDVNDSTIAYNTMYYNIFGIELDNCRNVTAGHNDIVYGMDGGGYKTYHIYVEDSGSWKLVDELHLSRHYRTIKIDLPPSSGSTYRIRIEQSGGEAAHIDYVAIEDGARMQPSTASYAGGESILNKILYEDKDVADAWGRTIELTWDGTFESPQLVMVANEEQPTDAQIPITTPHVMYPSFMKKYTLQDNGVITIDGMPDGLGDADFSDYWVPGSGHPDGYTYLWLRCDGDYLYATMEVTADNTYDETGWGSLYIYAGDGVKEFRVDASDRQYGTDGFVYTDKVAYQHMVYEFKIPLAEIGATVGDIIKIGYGSYGTLSPMSTGVYISGWMMKTCDNTVQYNTIEGYEYGVYLIFTDNETIAYNNLFNNSDGVWLTGCRDIDVMGNTILFQSEGFGDAGIWDGMIFCHNDLSYNAISGYDFGIYAGYTDNETIIGNNISYSYYAGIWLDEVNDSVVGHNTLYANGMYYGPGMPSGILLTDCYNISVFSNEINGTYMKNAGITISSEIFPSPECNNTLANNTIWGCFLGIYLEGTDNETIENNILFYNYYSIYLLLSVNNTIEDNDITNNSCGIYLEDSPRNNITDNYIAENYGDTGIYIDTDSNHTNITGNTITRNDVGIYVYGGNMSVGYENVDTQIHYNEIYGNGYGLVYDINDGDTPWINATYNWWGSANGPGSSGDNQQDPVTGEYAEGNGDWLSGNGSYDNIHFDPWLGLMLYQGWNLITPAFNESVQTASDLMDMIPGCTVVTMWDNIHQKYISYVDGFGPDFAIDNGSGYFVFVTQDVNIQFFDGLYQPTINITLYPGYNLIGWSYMRYSTAEDIADNITHCVKVAKWNAQEQTWVAEYITALGSYDFDMLMGEGAFVFVGGQTQWQVEPYWWI